MDYEAICEKIKELENQVKLLTNKYRRFETSFETIRDSIKELRKRPKAVIINPTDKEKEELKTIMERNRQC